MFDRLGPGAGNFKLLLGGKVFGRFQQPGEIDIQFGAEQVQHIRYEPGTLGVGRPALILRGELRFDSQYRDVPTTNAERPAERPPLSDQRIAAVSQLTISKPLRQPLYLKIGSMTKPLAALDMCVTDLVKSWGVDADRYPSATRAVEPIGPASWLADVEYPAAAQQKGAQALIAFRLSVDTSGRPTACHIQQSARPADFDEILCAALMRRARFKPALDKDKLPMPSFYRGMAFFRIQR